MAPDDQRSAAVVLDGASHRPQNYLSARLSGDLIVSGTLIAERPAHRGSAAVAKKAPMVLRSASMYSSNSGGVPPWVTSESSSAPHPAHISSASTAFVAVVYDPSMSHSRR